MPSAKQEKKKRLNAEAKFKFKNKEGQAELNQLEEDMEKLKLAYEQYFSGIINFAPEDRRMKLQNLVNRLMAMRITNPRIRFRFQAVMGRWVTYKSQWQRILRQIEAGTYKRDVWRHQRKLKQGEEFKSYYTKGKNPPGGAKETEPPAAEKGGGLGGERLDKIYNEYVSARQANNLSTMMKKEALGETLSRQADLVREKTGCDEVDFRVVEQGGSVAIQPVPIKKKSE